MRKQTFWGGVHPAGRKELSSGAPLEPCPPPGEVAIPLLQHIGKPCTPLVKVGDHVDMGQKLGDKAPKIFNVNWFRLDDEGHFIWPGFGDNLRVLEWILKRCEGKVDAEETSIGYVPKAEDINLEGLDFSLDTLKSILAVDNAQWTKEAEGIEGFYKKFGVKLPA